MNPTPNQITECDDEKQLCDLSFDLCYEVHYDQGRDNPNRFDSIRRADGSALFRDDWQPTSPTEKGKAQAWDLVVKYGLQIGLGLDDETPYANYRFKDGEYCENLHWNGECWCGHVKHENPQIAAVKAALLCAIGD